MMSLAALIRERDDLLRWKAEALPVIRTRKAVRAWLRARAKQTGGAS